MTTNPGAFQNPDDPGSDGFPFSELRGVDLPLGMTVTRKLLDSIAKLEEEGPAEGMHETNAAIGYLVRAVAELEVKIVAS